MVPFIIIAVIATAPSTAEEEIHRLVAQKQYDAALATIEKLLDPSSATTLEPKRRLSLEKARARCFFELGDYQSCERQVRALLAGPAGPGTPDHIECLAHLARALTFQDIHEEAIKVLEDALRLHDEPALHRLATTVLLRACRFNEILAHADALLAVDSSDPYAHFVRGIALSKKNRLEEAIRELTWGLKTPDAKRDAQFQLALVYGKLRQPQRALEYLLEILAENPYDQEACYQVTQQLVRIRTASAVRTAANMKHYFLTFKKAQGESSREYSFQAIGQGALAAIMRAARWIRLCVYERAIPEIRRSQAVARDAPEPFFYEADFWASVGLLAEAESALRRLEARCNTASGGVSARLRKLRAALQKGMEKIEAQANTALGRARLKVAQASWREARSPLAALLTQAVAAGRLTVADEAARLLLSHDPRSVRALCFFVERTTAPTLLVPRLHYLTRLTRLLPDDKHYRDRLRRARHEFLGKGSEERQ